MENHELISKLKKEAESYEGMAAGLLPVLPLPLTQELIAAMQAGEFRGKARALREVIEKLEG